nr:NAD-dependent epimerase/dehydratase family protein [uncultured Aquabacterium sp.]
MPTPTFCRPRAFRRSRLLIVGCGDVGQRVVRELGGRLRVRALTSSAERVPALRALGVTPLVGSLDQPHTLARLAGLGTRVLHLAPPPAQGRQDPRTAALLAALSRGGGLRSLVYGSTTGVYGDAGGAFFDETRAVAPQSDRAHRRVDAESRLRAFGRRAARAHGTAVSALRIPGIYAVGREGGDPRERIRRGAPVLLPEHDVFTNHIHADDLARACCLALWRARPQRVFHICDDSRLPMGDHFDAVADLSGLPRPARLGRDELRAQVSAMQWSFLCESRQLCNQRMKGELGLVLRHPHLSLVPSPLPVLAPVLASVPAA